MWTEPLSRCLEVASRRGRILRDMRLDTARRFALSLPETTEEPHFEKSSFRVRGKIFATVPLGGKHLNVHVDADEARALIADDPAAFDADRRPARR